MLKNKEDETSFGILSVILPLLISPLSKHINLSSLYLNLKVDL